MIKGRVLSVMLVFKLLLVCVIGQVHAENDRAFFWRVTSEQSAATVYLFGSVHFADKHFYPLRPVIEQAFSRSNNLVVELDVNNIDQETYGRLIADKGLYSNDETIKDHISDQTYKQLRDQLTKLNIEYEQVKRYKPGILVLTLTAAQVSQMGLDAQSGIDVYFLRKAATQSMPVIELETLQQQLNLFLDIPDAELLLKESLYSVAESEAMMGKVISFWKQGDVKQMNQLLFVDALEEYPAFSKIYDRLFYERNISMSKKIEQLLLQSEQNSFVVVGSGHLIGEQGIVKLLTNQGYKVDRL